jgi:hypothetical protein
VANEWRTPKKKVPAWPIEMPRINKTTNLINPSHRDEGFVRQTLINQVARN